MSNLEPKPQSTSKSVRHRLTGVALALITTAAAPGVAAEAANADQSTGGHTYPTLTQANGGSRAPEYTGKISAEELRINRSGQKGMNNLARRIDHGKVANLSENGHKWVQSGFALDGNPLQRLSLIVPASSLYDANKKAAYELDVVADTDREGLPNLNHVHEVLLSQGEIDPDTGSFSKTYSTLSMKKSLDTGIISVSGIYASPKDLGQYTQIQASVFPSSDGMPRLTADRLAGALDQAKDFVNGAIDQDPVGALGVAFSAPQGTTSL